MITGVVSSLSGLLHWWSSLMKHPPASRGGARQDDPPKQGDQGGVVHPSILRPETKGAQTGANV
jgi:hypothetical protein